MTIAFDFDDTITADPAGMIAMMRYLRDSRGHTVIVATLRAHWHNAEVDGILGTEFPVVYCAMREKDGVCRAAGYNVDIWIDDDPGCCKASVHFAGTPARDVSAALESLQGLRALDALEAEAKALGERYNVGVEIVGQEVPR